MEQGCTFAAQAARLQRLPSVGRCWSGGLRGAECITSSSLLHHSWRKMARSVTNFSISERSRGGGVMWTRLSRESGVVRN